MRRIAGRQLMHFVADAVVKPVGHITADELHRRHAANPLPIGLPERAVLLTAGFQAWLIFFIAGAPDDLTEPHLIEIGGEQALVTDIEGASGVRIDDAALVAAALRHLVGVPPEPPQLGPIPSHYK